VRWSRYTLTRDKVLTDFARQYLSDLLRRHGGNLARAARTDRMNRANLHKLLKHYGVDPNDFREKPVPKRPYKPPVKRERKFKYEGCE
jgi:DNA-binding NtrC family response regulator